MKIAYSFLLIILISSFTFAQKKELTLKDAIVGSRSYLRPEQLKSLQWRDNEHFVFVKEDTLLQYSCIKNNSDALLTLSDFQKLSLSRFPAFKFVDSQTIQFRHNQHLVLFNIEKKTVSLQLSIPENAENLSFCETSKTLAYTKGQNLFVLNKDGEMQITFDSEKGILNGHYVHRREFGITKGIFWSSTGKQVAFYHKDESMVNDYPLVDFMAREAEYTPIKYPMAGMKSHQVTVGIYDLESRKTIFLNTGKPDEHYLTNISWGPNEQFVYIAELNRGQDHMQMNKYEVSSGEKVKTLFEETSNTYVEPQHPIIFSSSDPEQFYYWTRKDGWFHLYLYDTSGKQIRQITKGNWEVTNFYGADKKYVYIQSTKESPIERHLYKVKITNGEITRLDRTAGTHQANFSSDFNYLLDQWEAFNIPGQTDLSTSAGKLVRTINKADNPVADFQFGENKIVTIKADDDSTTLYGRMILPANFNQAKKYPTIIYVYGGPHTQLVNNTWHNDVRWWQYYMTSHGFILFTVDSRGSGNRGAAFENVIHQNLGIAETADQMRGIEYLKSLPYVDANRIGVHGWSYGGFMTLNLMLRHPETFKVGVAGGPVVDWSMYEIMYGERYMDTPQENPTGYQEANMTNHVNNLQGKLMLVHGAQDPTVVMQHSMKFLRECVRQNKPVDFFTYPTHPHNVRGKDRVHLMDKVSQYFLDYL